MWIVLLSLSMPSIISEINVIDLPLFFKLYMQMKNQTEITQSNKKKIIAST